MIAPINNSIDSVPKQNLRSENITTPTIEHLPEEILLLIFKNIPSNLEEFSRRDEVLLVHTALCKRSWHRIILYDLLLPQRNKRIKEACFLVENIAYNSQDKNFLNEYILLKERLNNSSHIIYWLALLSKIDQAYRCYYPEVLSPLEIPPTCKKTCLQAMSDSHKELQWKFFLLRNTIVSCRYFNILLLSFKETNISKLHFIECYFLGDFNKELTTTLRSCTVLKRFSFVNCKMSNEYQTNLFNGFVSNPVIEDLFLQGSDIHPSALKSLLTSTTLKILHLVNCNLDKEHLEVIGEALSTNRSLETLDLAFNLLHEEDLLKLCIGVNNTLKKLNLIYTGITSCNTVLLRSLKTFYPKVNFIFIDNLHLI